MRGNLEKDYDSRRWLFRTKGTLYNFISNKFTIVATNLFLSCPEINVGVVFEIELERICDK